MRAQETREVVEGRGSRNTGDEETQLPAATSGEGPCQDFGDSVFSGSREVGLPSLGATPG